MDTSSFNQYDIIMNQQSNYDDPLVQYFLNEDTTSSSSSLMMNNSSNSIINNNNFDIHGCGNINDTTSMFVLQQDPIAVATTTTHHSYPSSPSVVPNSSPYDSNSSSLSTPEQQQQQQCFIVDTSSLNGHQQQLEQQQQHMLYNDYSSMQPIFDGQQQQIAMAEFPVVEFDAMTNNNVDTGIHISEPTVDAGEYQMFSSSSPDQLDTQSPLSSNEDSIESEESNTSPAQSSNQSNKQKKRGTETRVQNLVHPLTREELLKLSGKEPVKITEQDSAVLADERSFKKQRRLVKNRESAQLSRMRKKIFIEDLEKKISDLTSENKSLRDEVLYLQGILKQVSKNHPEVSRQIQHHESMRTKNAKAAGVCLLIMIFSIGIFLNPQQATQSQQLQPFTNSLINTRRVISNVENNNIALPEITSPEYIQSSDVMDGLTAAAAATASSSSMSSSSLKTPKRALEPAPSTPTQQEKKRIRIIPTSEDDASTTDHLTSVGRIESPRPTRVNREDSSSPATPNIVGDGDFNIVPSSRYQDGPVHSSYIICSDQPRMVSNNLNQTTQSLLNSNPATPLTIGLLIPSDTLGINVTNGNLPQERAILEISCQVNNIRIWNPLSIQDHLQSPLMTQRSYDSNTDLVIHSP
ncbi:hypothetical protein SAMD00019534_122150, partial [Acytostelium subglobosum LB1]|uniref:hypothetical protein n=1 Tax=Acytostelium subglobosum LB1 TaxID=1410327 RepID=UPI000644A28D